MTVASEIIEQAFRENNLIAIGKTVTDAEKAEALPRLNNIVRSLFGRDLGLYLTDWQIPPTTTSPVNARYPLLPQSEKLPASVWPYPPANVRLIASQSTATTVYLTQSPQDGARFDVVFGGADFPTSPLTIDANGRLISGAGQLVFDETPTLPRQFMYRADLAQWTEIVALEEDTVMPLPEEFDDYFIAALNIRLSPRYSVQPSAVTAAVMSDQLSNIKSRYWQEEDTARVRTSELRTYQSYPNASYIGEDF